MITCNINITNQSNCKSKISNSNTDNKCKVCDHFFCKKHLPRHKCVKQEEQQQQMGNNLQKSKEEEEKEKELEKKKLQDIQEEQRKKQEEENKSKQSKKTLINYNLEKQEEIITHEITYDKNKTWNQEANQIKNKNQYERSQRKQLERMYVVRDGETFDRRRGKQTFQDVQRPSDNYEEQKQEKGGYIQKYKDDYYEDEEMPFEDEEDIREEQRKNREKNKKFEEEMAQKKQEILKKQLESGQLTSGASKNPEEIRKKIQNCLLLLGKQFQNYKKNKMEEEQQNEKEGKKTTINEQDKNINKLLQKNEKVQPQQQQQQKKVIYRKKEPNFTGNLFDAYEKKNEENKKALDEYQDILKRELEENIEIEPQQELKKQIYDNIEKNITIKKNIEPLLSEIKYPEKPKDQYYFKSIHQEGRYQKMLPMSVKFPGDPYQLQQDYIFKILKALDSPQEQNILLETPSGTGKTLSLLTSVLAFLQKHREKASSGYRYQIVYASRTYQQLQQIANEVKKTGYDIRCTILGQQQEMCVNNEVLDEFFRNNKARQNQNFSYYCQTACKSQRCKAQQNSNVKMQEKAKERKIIDIEEIDNQTRNFNTVSSTCPYYDSRNNIDSQDLILVPYDIILDERGIKRLGKIPRRLLIIFDEAHNVLEEACNGSSYKLDLQTLEKVLYFVDSVRNEVQQNIQMLNQRKSIAQSNFFIQQKQMQIQHFRYILGNAKVLGYDDFQIENIQGQLHSLENDPMQQFQDQELKRMQEVIDSVGVIKSTLQLTYQNFKYEAEKNHNKKLEKYKLADTYPRMIAKLFAREEDEIKLINLLKSLKKVRDYSYFTKTNTNNRQKQDLAQMSPCEDVIFFFHSILLSVKPNQKFYRLMAHFQEKGYLNEPIKNLTYVFQCFEPEVALKRLLRFPQSHFILTSSTLTPFESFLKEFSKLKHLKSMPFQTHLFRNHVIEKTNFMGRILNIPQQINAIGKAKKEWQCFHCKTMNFPERDTCRQDKCGRSRPSWLKFTRKKVDSYDGKPISKDGQKLFEELGHYFEELVEVIPGGLILIFPSLHIMEKCRYAWFEGSQYGAILEKHKKIFLQPRKKHEYRNVIEEYKKEVMKNGHGILFSVSQTDFLDSFEIKDALSRAIFIIGKPGMDSSDGYVQEKMEYLENSSKSHIEGKRKMDKWHWFNDYSIREINKSIGKVIRHNLDYGCVFLIDDVYNTSNWIVDRISEWARQRFEKETDIKQLVGETKAFFSQKFQEPPSEIQENTLRDAYTLYHDEAPMTQYEKDLQFIQQQTTQDQPLQNKSGFDQGGYNNNTNNGDDEDEDDDFM